jgi:hypothetical protein
MIGLDRAADEKATTQSKSRGTMWSSAPVGQNLDIENGLLWLLWFVERARFPTLMKR